LIDDDANILGHGQEHLTKILRLLFLMGGQGHFADLGEAVHQGGDLRPKSSLISSRVAEGVLTGIVEQPGDHRRDVIFMSARMAATARGWMR